MNYFTPIGVHDLSSPEPRLFQCKICGAVVESGIANISGHYMACAVKFNIEKQEREKLGSDLSVSGFCGTIDSVCADPQKLLEIKSRRQGVTLRNYSVAQKELMDKLKPLKKNRVLKAKDWLIMHECDLDINFRLVNKYKIHFFGIIL